ncbi:MAG: phenylalanine--tRNA ligase subunit alpha [Planctomycetota bacterium]|nr:MAG: phenylalanine--tRNA ligase subunit alpha [Planctomycetota bacterium]
MLDELETVRKTALEEVAAAGDAAVLDKVEVRYLGRSGEITQMLKSIGKLPAEERPAFGKRANEVKSEVAEAVEARGRELMRASLESDLDSFYDTTLPGTNRRPLGNIHPLMQVRETIEDLFTSMGFIIAEGPEIETDYYNFEALNIPDDHPAKDIMDTFWLTDGNLLRTHTSPVQVRAMEKYGVPIRCIAPGRVFRYEALDASHEHTFDQCEGLMVEEGISVAHLIYFMKELLRGVFERDVKIRLRPGYFPFVEPGFELDMHCMLCEGKGCPVCKQSGWVEMLPCGLVHPNVLKYCKVDPSVYSGFAFGLGLTRLVMQKYGIEDIRLMCAGDLRFLQQF